MSAQLVQVPSGTVLRPITSQVTSGEIFQLQDDLAQSIVQTLSLSLTSREQGRINRDVPAKPGGVPVVSARQRAAARFGSVAGGARTVPPLRGARSAVRTGVGAPRPQLPADRKVRQSRRTPPTNLAKRGAGPQAGTRHQPDLSLAHNLYAQFEVEAGRAREAMVRLLDRVRRRRRSPSCLPGWSMRAATAGCSTPRKRPTSARAGSIRTSSPASRRPSSSEREWDRAIAVDTSTTPIAKILAMVYGGRRAEARELLRALVARDLPGRAAVAARRPVGVRPGRSRTARRFDSSHDRFRRGHGSGSASTTGPARSPTRAITIRRSGCSNAQLDAGYCPASDARERSAFRSGPRVERFQVPGAAS